MEKLIDLKEIDLIIRNSKYVIWTT